MFARFQISSFFGILYSKFVKLRWIYQNWIFQKYLYFNNIRWNITSISFWGHVEERTIFLFLKESVYVFEFDFEQISGRNEGLKNYIKYKALKFFFKYYNI